MKNKAFIIIAILFISVKTFSQNYYEITFEGNGVYENDFRHFLYRDTISNPANIWQIGAPQKTVFTSASSLPNAIVTDTLNYYPINDTSSFIIRHIADLGFVMNTGVLLAGKYNVHSDTLIDFGSIEFSPDNGSTWIDLNTTTVYASNIMWTSPEPILSGNSTGWKSFSVVHQGLGVIFGISIGDTVMWRFTFRSDGIQTNKDGLMFDSIYVWDVPPIGVNDMNSDNSIGVDPNPTNGGIIAVAVTSSGVEKQIEVYNLLGEKLFTMPVEANQKEVKLDLSTFSKGMYLIKVETENGVLCKKIIKE